MFSGHPEELQDRLDELEELCWGDEDRAGGAVVGLHSADRDAAFAALGG